ncbi:hypothetical protein J22TS1_43400 [Siminovitchia terrae]|nr:hypothetical protein J22TS1_43400 [Siminovitchia terrae]
MLYPIVLGIAGKVLLSRGAKLNQEDFNTQLANGKDTHILSIDAGTTSILFGYYLWIMMIPFTIIIGVLVLLRFLRK